MNTTMMLIFLPLFFTITIQSPQHRNYINSIKRNTSDDPIYIPPQEYFHVTRPLPTDDITPSCSINVFNHTFKNTFIPVSVNYTPPPVTCEWSHVVLEFRAECKGKQHDRVTGVWIDGVEILRTSAPQSNEEGIVWNIRKDVSKYSSVITQHNLKLSVMLQYLVEDEFNGFYFVNITLLFYSDKVIKVPLPRESEAEMLNRKLTSVTNNGNDDMLRLDQVMKSLYTYDMPADLIIPISGSFDDGFWFRIQDELDVRSKKVQVSPKTYKAMLELYVSFHGDDEFWYMNPPDSYVKANNLTKEKAKGAFREVLVSIDGSLVGTVIPFPVIYSGGINSLFWKPVVSIGAFDLPSYDIDFTPFLGLVLDNKKHSIGFQVTGCNSFWLVDANLHLWLDHSYVKTIVKYSPPSLEIEQEYEFKGLDGEFVIEVERSGSALGWVKSSKGNLKTKVTEEITFHNKLNLFDFGTRKELDQKIKTKTKIKVTNDKGHIVGKFLIEKMYPLKITSVTKAPGHDKGTFQMDTTVVHGKHVSFSNEKDSIKSVTSHNQNCTGSMLVKDDYVISGSAENHQKYDCKDEFGCYSRQVDVVGGDVITDETCSICFE